MVETAIIALITPIYAFLITIIVELFRIERILGAHTEAIRKWGEVRKKSHITGDI
ncbi:MAG: hypothetical protein WAV32_03055 [Halobacteriota archaeon]